MTQGSAEEDLVYDFGHFRVITRKPKTEYGDTVFVQEFTGSSWEDRRSFNSLSDDYAFSNAKDDAKQRDRAVVGEIAGNIGGLEVGLDTVVARKGSAQRLDVWHQSEQR